MTDGVGAVVRDESAVGPKDEIPAEDNCYMLQRRDCSAAGQGCTPKTWTDDVGLAAWREAASAAQEIGREGSECWVGVEIFEEMLFAGFPALADGARHYW